MGCQCFRQDEESRRSETKYRTLNEIYIPAEKLKRKSYSPNKTTNTNANLNLNVNESTSNMDDSSISNFNYKRLHQSLKDTTNFGSFKIYCDDFQDNFESKKTSEFNSNLVINKNKSNNLQDIVEIEELAQKENQKISGNKLVIKDKSNNNNQNEEIKNNNIEESNYTSNIVKEKQTRNLARKTTALLPNSIVIVEKLSDSNILQRHSTQHNLNHSLIDEDIIFCKYLT